MLTFRRLINTAKAPLTLLPAEIRYSTSISYLPSALNILLKYTTSCTCSNILSFTLILYSALCLFLSNTRTFVYSHSGLDHCFYNLRSERDACNAHSDDEMSTASAYSRQFTFKSPTFTHMYNIQIKPWHILV